MIQSPQPFVIRQECYKVAFQNGFRRKLGEIDGCARFTSTTVAATVHLGAWDRIEADGTFKAMDL